MPPKWLMVGLLAILTLFSFTCCDLSAADLGPSHDVVNVTTLIPVDSAMTGVMVIERNTTLYAGMRRHPATSSRQSKSEEHRTLENGMIIRRFHRERLERHWTSSS